MRIDRPVPMRTAFMKSSFRFYVTPLRLVCLTFAILALDLRAAGPQTEVQLWPVDALVKVFPDDVAPAPVGGQPTRLEVAAGETASLQFVLRASRSLTNVRATLAPFVSTKGKGRLEPRPVRQVGFVPVDRPTQRPSRDQLRPPPADYPDPLLEGPAFELAANRSQPLWLTVPVGEETAPGVYRSTLTVTAQAGARTLRERRPVEIEVAPVRVGASRLWVTDWFAMHWPHLAIQPEPESEAYYALLRRYARNLAEHRHNVALISPLGLARFSVAPGSGGLEIDFSRFDRWVRIFEEEGVIGRIEGGHIGGRKAGWESEFVVTIQTVREGRVVAESVDPASPEADRFYARFFPALVAHLKERGWLSAYVQHLADEPIPANLASYRALAALARRHAPQLPIVEACHTKDLVGSIDVWVPQLNYWADDFAHYQARQRAGEEVWFYTCVFPQGEYANRFIELPLMKTRVLHWLNFRYGATGYLHWGYNHWTADSPFTHTTRPHGGPPYLPAGDPWIVYPGKDGPLDSIRFEAMRDGIADYELLCRLAERDPAAAEQLAARVVLAFDRYQTDVPAFRAVRHELLDRLARLASAGAALSNSGSPVEWLVEAEPAGDWNVRVKLARRTPLGTPVSVSTNLVRVTPPEEIQVEAERHDTLPVFNPNTAGWVKGVPLRALRAQETTTPFLLDPGSVVVRTGPEPGAETFQLGRDYEIDPVWGSVGRKVDGRIREGQAVYASYRWTPLRLDAVVRTGDGRIELRRGEPRAAAPAAAAVGLGEVRLANLWLPGRLTRISATNLFPVLEHAFPELASIGATPAERWLPKTLARLRQGEPLRVLAWGDSVTDGGFVPDPARNRWQAQFIERLRAAFPRTPIELVTEAWGGRNTASYLAEPPGSPHNYREKVLGARPHLIVSEFVNDAGLTPAQVEERYTRFLEDFRSIGAEWIILTPHYVRPDWMNLDRERDIDRDPRPYVAGLRAFAARHDVALADAAARYGRLWRQGIPYTSLLLNSINHPDAQGMRLFADALMALGFSAR